MSHIPAAAMPHAQAHHDEPHHPAAAASPPPAKPETPWLAMAIGGTLAIGGAITAAWLLRRDAKPKAGRKAKAGATPRKRKAKLEASRASRPAAD